MATGQKFRQIGTFVVSIFIYLLLMIVIEQIGLSSVFANALTAFLLVLMVMVPATRGGAIRSGKFFFAERNITTGTNALAIVTTVFAPFLLVASGYIFFNSPGILIIFLVCICTALAISTLLIGKPFRQSGATSLANFHRYKFENSLSARLSACVSLVAGVLLFLAGLIYATEISVWFFGISKNIVVALLCTGVVLVSGFGGLASATRQSAIAMVLLLIALNIPLAISAFSQDSIPIGHLTFANTAMEPVFEIENQLVERGLPVLGESIILGSETADWNQENWGIAAVLLLLGTLSAPGLMQQFSVTRTSYNSSISGQKSILVTGFIFLTLFALLAYTKISLYETLLGLTTGEIRQDAQFLYSSPTGFISICDQVITSAAEAVSACGGDPNYVIALSDLAISGNLMLATSSLLLGYPYALTGLSVIAILCVLLAFCSSTLLATSNNLISAYYSTSDDQLASVELFLSRFTIFLVAFLTAFILSNEELDPIRLILFAFSIYAVCLAPSTLSLFLWKRTSMAAVAASTGISFLLIVVLWVLTYFGMDLSLNTDDQVKLNLPVIGNLDPANCGIVILPISVTLLVVLNILYPFKAKPLQNALDKEFEEAIFDDDDKVVIAKNRF